MNEVREEVRRRYAESALAVISGTARGCCPDKDTGASFGSGLYEAEQRGELPGAAVEAVLGCGNPLWWPTCARGRRCSTWARAVVSTCCCRPGGWARPWQAYGLDMTDEMLELARA